MASGVRGSLALQVLLFFHRFLIAAVVIISLLVYIYKGMTLPYPPNAIGWEVAFTVALLVFELARLALATRGNLTELAGPVLWSIGLAIPTIIAHVYFVQLQTYVLRIDQILHGAALVFVVPEVLLAALTLPAMIAAAGQF